MVSLYLQLLRLVIQGYVIESALCPRSDPNYQHVNEFFSNKLHDKLCDELANYDFSGIFAYCGFNEPLIKKDIYRGIEYARKNYPIQK